MISTGGRAEQATQLPQIHTSTNWFKSPKARFRSNPLTPWSGDARLSSRCSTSMPNRLLELRFSPQQ